MRTMILCRQVFSFGVVLTFGIGTAYAERTTSYTYTPQAQVETVDGPRLDVTDITTYRYDDKGNRVLVRNALGQETHTTAFDGAGRPLTIVDPNGLTTQLRYDPRSRLLSQQVSDGLETREIGYTYDPVGNLTQVDSSGGARLRFYFDTANRLIGLEDGAGNRIDYTLDAMGNRLETRVSDPTGTLTQQQRQVYNQLGRLIQSIDAQDHATGYAYDANGNLTQTTDARQNPTQQAYDALDRLQQTTDALDGITHYTYDAQDNLTSVTDPNGLTTRYEYDGLGDLITQTSPDTGTTTYTYDEAGNRLTQTDARGIVVSCEYDALNRLTAIHYPDSSLDVSYGYDQGPNGIGRLSSMTDAQGVTDYSYNAFGQLTGKTRTASDGIVSTLGYAYDSFGRLSRMDYPSGEAVLYGYDDQGQLNSLERRQPDGTQQPLVTNIRYLPFGPIQAFDYGNGLSLTRSFDLNYRLIEQRVPGVLQSHYEHDPVGNTIQWQELLDTGRDQQFGYDQLDRLTSASGAYGELGYSYDATGNRLSFTDGTQSETYSYSSDSHRLQQILGTTSDIRNYDEAGNTLQSLIGSYRYDDSNRMIGFNKGGVQTEYAYNGRGERIKKTTNQGGDGSDYLAMAEAAEAQAQDYGAAADTLEQQAQVSDSEAAQLRSEADDAQRQAAQSTLEAEGLNLAVKEARQAAEAVEQEVVRLTQHAADYRAKIKTDPRNFKERLQNAANKKLAEAAEKLAAKATEEAQSLQAKGDNLASQAEAKQAQAEVLTQQAVNQRQAADAKEAEAAQRKEEVQGQRQLAQQAEAQAAEYRRLAEEGNSPGIETTTRFVYDEQGRLIGEYNQAGAPIREYIYLAGQPVALLAKDVQSQEQTLYNLHTDHLGAVVKATDSAQTLVWDVQRKPFGDRTVLTAQIEMPLGFPGQYFDEETGNYYNYFRDYDPSTGRYLQSDPIGLDGGINAYAYVSSNPLAFIDPLGLVKWTGSIRIVDASIGPKIGKIRIPVLSRNEITLNLESECVNGKKVKVALRAVNPDSHDWHHSPVNFFSGDADVEDSQSTPVGSALSGPFYMNSFGIGYGKGEISTGVASGSFNGGGVIFGHMHYTGVVNLLRPPEEVSCECEN